MSNLIANIQGIQRLVGADADGIFGPRTAELVYRALNGEDTEAQATPGGAGIDARSLRAISTLDKKAQEIFQRFIFLAKATAATLGCDYVMLAGHRTWEEQDALYAQGRTLKGARVTNARGGQSNHNFGIAADFGVFRGKTYLDETKPELAARVHRACSLNAAGCGLEWGGSWKSMADLPHYEVATGLTMMRKRELYQKGGTVL